MQPPSSPLGFKVGRDDRSAAPRWLRESFRPCAVVLAAVAAAIFVRLGLVPSLDITAPLMPFVPAILIGAWLGGLGPGLFATLVGTIVGGYLFLSPGPSLDNVEPHEWLRLVIFLASGIVVSALIEQMHRARRRADRLTATLESSEARLAAILDQLPVGVGVLDGEGRFVLTNPVMDRLSMQRIPSTDAVPHARWRLVDDSGHPLDPKEWPGARALRGESVSPGIEGEYTNEEGERTWFSIAAQPLRNENGVVECAVVVVQDIDRIKRASEALEEADRRKDAFLATLAHELRNPLAPIKNAVDILNLRGPGDPLLQNARDVIGRQVGYMVRLIDDLLDVSRITQGKLELRREPVELRSVIEHALETVRPHIERSRQRLVMTLPEAALHVFADPVRLAQVLTNVLSNASKYSFPESTITLTAAADGGQAVVTVDDEGIGIEPDHARALFAMFAQASPALDRSQGGLGIGLWLSRRLIEMQGGTIEAASQGRGRGSRFTIALPQHKAMAARDAPANAAQACTRSARVLVVDDNTDGAATLAELLRATGHEVEVAYDGAEALQAAHRFAPDVLLLDIGLPKMNGYEVCRKIRQEPWGRRLAIVAMTGWGQAEDRRRSRAAGFDAHLVKPIDYRTVALILENGPAAVSEAEGTDLLSTRVTSIERRLAKHGDSPRTLGPGN